MANDHDIDGSSVSFVSFGSVANGIVRLDKNGDLVFVPESGFTGTASFQYTVADPEGATATGTVTVTVGAQPPATSSTTLVASAEQAVSDTAIGSHSAIARFSDGGYVVVWGGQTGNGDWDIYAKRYNTDGQALASSILVNTTTTGNQYNAVVTTLADGGFVVAWSGPEGDSTGVFAQRYDAAGQAAGGQFQVNTTTPNSQVPYSILGLSDGGFAVSWASMGQDGDGSWAAIGRIFNADGTARTGETLLNQTVSWDQSMPVLVEASPSEIMAVWSSRGQDGDGFGGIMARRFSSTTGIATTDELPQINAYGISDQYRPRAIQLDDGTYVVAWRSLGQDGSSWGVFGRHLDADGIPVGSDFSINNNQYLSQYEVSLAALDDGGFVAVWEGEGQDGSGFGVFAQRFDAAMGRVGEEFVVAESLQGNQSAPQVAAGENGSFTVSWHSSHTGSPGIYSRSFTRDHDLAPVVVANDVSLAANSGTGTPVNVVSASTLFAVGHPQGSDEVRAGLGTLSRYRFSDQTSSASSGYLTVNGAGMPALHTVEILAEHLGDVGFAAGSAGTVDTILVSGFDGVRWSDWESVTVTSLATTGLSGTPVASREIQVNSAVGGGTPSMVRLADGGYVVTWHVTGPSASDPDIYARRYDASGRPVGGEIRVNTVTSNVQASPVVGALEDGGFVIAWNSSDGSSRNVMAQRFDRAGQAVGTEFGVNQTIPSDQVVHSITGLGNGGFVVGWSGLAQDGDGSWASLGRVYDAAGHAATGEFVLNAYTSWDQSRPTAVQISDTEFLATWTSRGQDGSGHGGIMVRRFDIATGAAVGGEVQVNTTTVGDQFRSDIVALTDQTYVVVWNSMSQDGSGWGTYGQRISSNGSMIGTEFQINTATASDQNNVRIAALEDGGFVAVWDSLNQDGSGSGIYGQRFTVAAGATTPQVSGGEFLVAEVMAGDQTLPAVVSRPDGGFTVTWQSTVTGSPQLESRTFANAASPLWVAGTTSNDTLTGQLGNDTLVGGLGNDTLAGGVGADSFRYEGSTDGWDTITDFQSGTDRIEVVGAAFGGLAEGALDPGRFALNTAADADDRFVFNTSTRILYYDSNGSASGGTVSLAYLTAGTITAADIRVVA
ncbi:Ig-like domain-containing protein [Azospirillum oleiclasticum]|uniref:Ig-like domain-containing protein n=1 Tax=Azospirillum oleiclasticum TaxID=2735135 RepID=UPI001FFE8971|nr:cadherin-like domain-containing protein [Azospirillum oleiclasticum]